jgi:signal transduction histidine kinase
MVDERLEVWNSTSLALSQAAVTNSEGAREAGATPAPDKSEFSTWASVTGPQPGAEPVEKRARPTLLVVDDEAEVLRSIHDLLRIDYHVITFERGSQALEFLRSDATVQVILVDQRMPEMTGVEVLRQAMAIRPETTRLLFTAYSDVHTVIDAINQGHVFRFVAKPCDPELLGAVVRQGVEHHDLIVEKNRLLADLRETNAKLIEANRLKGAFIEVASHELNTPITVVLGIIELWKMSQGESASPVELQWVDRIGAAASRLARIVERMLKLVRNRDFSQSLDTELIDLESVARRAIEELSPYLELRRQSVIVDIEPNLGYIEADSTKIADVLINLLANAVKFTPDGGTIGLLARGEPAAPDWIRVQVTDQGMGVSPADQQHLFEPFFTGFDTLRHSSGDYQFGKRGIGLGLWLVKTFVELHGGRVEVCSTPGVGSTFAFVLPRSQATSRTRSQVAQPGAGSSNGGSAPRSAWPTAV